MKKKILALSVLIGLLAAGGAAAYHYEIWEKNELKDSFCSKMSNKKLYNELKVENYATLIPGKEGWIFRTGNDFRTEWALNDTTIGYMTELRDALKEKNVDIVFVMPPIRGLVHADEMYRRYKGKYGMNNPNLSWSNYEAMLDNLRKNGFYVAGVSRDKAPEDFFYRRDHHWTASGARATAESVAEVVKQIPAYSQIPKQEYQSVEQEPVEYDSSFGKAFRKMCDTSLPTEVIKPFETTPKDSGSDQASLFGDGGSNPQVILLGTSNSVQETSQANFEGFLKEKLSADVLNLSYVGAGIDTSIMQFVNSPQMQDMQPKIALWEIPGYYDLNVMDDKLFNQIIPAVYGSCGTDSIFSTRVKLKGGYNQLMKTAKPLNPTPAYVHLSFDEPVTGKFSMSFQFGASGSKKQQFDRFDGYQADGEFYTLFPADVEPSQWRAISLQVPQSLAGQTVNMEICGDPKERAHAAIPQDILFDGGSSETVGSGAEASAAPVPENREERSSTAQPVPAPMSTQQQNAVPGQDAAKAQQQRNAAAAPVPETAPVQPVTQPYSPAADATATPPASAQVAAPVYGTSQKDTVVAKYRDSSPDAKTEVEWKIKTP